MFFEVNRQNTSASMFARGGALFFSLLFLGWLNLSDVYEAVQGLFVLSGHILRCQKLVLRTPYHSKTQGIRIL